MNDTTQNTQPAAFCTRCGRPLAQPEVRMLGTAVVCQPCLEADAAARSTGYTPVGQPGFVPGDVAAAAAPNPGLAVLLGFIPGVGAMYNGQYAKGIVHLAVFALLVSLADANGIFGLFVAGWIAYMVFDAYHTARARREGTPIPNPFNLNDVGDRLGFGRNWARGTAPMPAQAPPAPAYSASAWGTPSQPAAEPPLYANPYTAPGHGIPYSDVSTASAGYSSSGQPEPPFVATAGTRGAFPAGAAWLIGLGVFFLLATTGWFESFRAGILIGLGLIALGLFTFIRCLTRPGIAPDGSQNQLYRVFRASRGAVWLVLVGVLFLLNDFNVLRWHRSWPLFIIVAGLMTLLERTAMNSFAYPAPYPTATAQTSIVPAPVPPTDLNQEKGGY